MFQSLHVFRALRNGANMRNARGAGGRARAYCVWARAGVRTCLGARTRRIERTYVPPGWGRRRLAAGTEPANVEVEGRRSAQSCGLAAGRDGDRWSRLGTRRSGMDGRGPGRIAVLREADARTRTADPFITSEVLYQLSYVGIVQALRDSATASAASAAADVLQHGTPLRLRVPGRELVQHRCNELGRAWRRRLQARAHARQAPHASDDQLVEASAARRPARRATTADSYGIDTPCSNSATSSSSSLHSHTRPHFLWLSGRRMPALSSWCNALPIATWDFPVSSWPEATSSTG
jgi:hypothetical protein